MHIKVYRLFLYSFKKGNHTKKHKKIEEQFAESVLLSMRLPPQKFDMS